MGTRVMHNRSGDVRVYTDDLPPWKERASYKPDDARFDPAIAQNYSALRELFFDRVKAEAALGQSKGGTLAEQRLDEETLKRLYDQFLDKDIDPLSREDLREMAQEIYLEVQAGYRQGERTDKQAVQTVAEVFGRAIRERTEQERLTEELLEDIYKKTYRAFLASGAYHLIPELQTIYLGTLVKLRTHSYAADINFYQQTYGDPQRATEAYKLHHEQKRREQKALLKAAELPKTEKARGEAQTQEQPSLSERVRRFHASRDELDFYEPRIEEQARRVEAFLPHADAEHREELGKLSGSIRVRAALARTYFAQAERELRAPDSATIDSILSLFEHTVRSVGSDIQRLDAFLPSGGDAALDERAEQAQQQKSAQDMMREMLPERRALFAQWTPLFERLKSRKSLIDTIRSTGAANAQAAATHIDQGVRTVLAMTPPLKTLEEGILSEIVEKGTASSDHLLQYRDMIDRMQRTIHDVSANADALKL